MYRTTETLHSETPDYRITIKRYFLHKDDGACIVFEDVIVWRKSDRMHISYENRPYAPPDIEKIERLFQNLDSYWKNRR